MLVLAFIAIFQFEPLGRMANFCPSLLDDDHCCTAVPLLVELLETSIDLPPTWVGERLYRYAASNTGV